MECYATYSGLVGSILLGHVGRHEVDDVRQRVFYELWLHRERFDPTRNLGAWISSIAHKRAIDHHRKNRRVDEPIDLVGDVIGIDGREQVERLCWALEVGDALATLPESERAILRLAYFDGYSQTQIAALLDTPLGTVKTRNRLGLRRLAEKLQAPPC